jgi:hypothetical protein
VDDSEFKDRSCTAMFLKIAVELEYRYAEDTMPRGVPGSECGHVQGLPAVHRESPGSPDRPG